MINEVEGCSNKAYIFKESNKRTLLLKTKLHTNFCFPILQQNYLLHRINTLEKNENSYADILTRLAKNAEEQEQNENN